MSHYAATRVERPKRHMNAHGQLVLAEPYRWNPSVASLTVRDLKHRLWLEPEGSYAQATALDELDRRAPKTASLCYDVSKGWEPLCQKSC